MLDRFFYSKWLIVSASVFLVDIVYGDEPAQPVWPETFTQNFTDISYWPSGSYNTRGTYRWHTKY